MKFCPSCEAGVGDYHAPTCVDLRLAILESDVRTLCASINALIASNNAVALAVNAMQRAEEEAGKRAEFPTVHRDFGKGKGTQ